MRYYEFLRTLAQHHDVTLVSLTRRTHVDDETRQELERFATLQVYGSPREDEPFVIGAAGRLPSVGTQYQRALRARWAVRKMRVGVRDMLRHEHFGLIFFSGKETYPVIADITDVPIVADCCDVDHVRYASEMRYCGAARRAWLAMRYLEVRKIEHALMEKVPDLMFASERDRRALAGETLRGAVFPQGVDCERWKRTRKPKANTVVFTGVMRYPPNHDAALQLVEHVMPRVCNDVGEAECFIVGRDPQSSLLNAAKSATRVTVTGTVDDIHPYLELASVFVAPLRFASGIQNKILEAMAAEVPVVTTRVVADGLKLPGVAPAPVCVCDSPTDIAQATSKLLNDKQLRTDLARKGRQFVEEHFTWRVILDRFEQHCERAATRVPRQVMAA